MCLSSFLWQILSSLKMSLSFLPFEIPHGVKSLWFMLNRSSVNIWWTLWDLCNSYLHVTSRIMPCFFHLTLAWVLQILKTQRKKAVAPSGNLTHALHQSDLISTPSETPLCLPSGHSASPIMHCLVLLHTLPVKRTLARWHTGMMLVCAASVHWHMYFLN